MVFFQITPVRIIQIFIGFGSIATFFLYITYRIFKQKLTRLKLLLSAVYLFVAAGLIVNLIYAPITISEVASFLNLVTVFLSCFGTGFLAVFTILFYSKEQFRSKYQYSYIIVLFLILIGIFFIPNANQIDEITNWYPKFSLELTLYLITVETLFYLVPTLIYSIKSYVVMDDKILKKQWLLFILGMFELYSVLIGTFITNTLNISIIRTVWSIISLILSVTGAYLMYYALIKRL